MKKIIATIGLIAGMSFSISAANAATAVTYGATAGSVTPALCAPLGSTVTLTNSAGVSGSYRCSEAYNLITVATCHNGGSAKPSTVTCEFTQSSDPALVTMVLTDATTGYYNDDTCVEPAAGEAEGTFETSARKAYSASSAGGTISGVDLGEGTACTSDATLAIVTP